MKKIAQQLADGKEKRFKDKLEFSINEKYMDLLEDIKLDMDFYNSDYYIYNFIYYWDRRERLVTEKAMEKLENEGFTVKRLWLRNKWKISWGD